MIPELDEFAKHLIENVRDAAIQNCDRTLSEQHAVAKRWKKAAMNNTSNDFAKILIPDIVDETMFCMLHAIDGGLLRLSYTAANGRTIDLGTEGLKELAGWYMGSHAWRAKYAKERFVDDFADLT